MYKIILLLMFLVLVSCTNGKNINEPQKALSNYISMSFTLKDISEKGKLLDLTTGKTKELLSKISDEDFKNNFINVKKEFVSLAIKDERKIGDDKYSITYEISYLTNSKDAKDKVINKKHVLLLKDNNKWMISEVQNLKTLIEYQNEMAF